MLRLHWAKTPCVACVTLDPERQINPGDNRAHPDLDIYRDTVDIYFTPWLTETPTP